MPLFFLLLPPSSEEFSISDEFAVWVQIRPDQRGIYLVYLIPKIKGEKLTSDYVAVLDNLYGYDPNQLPYNKSMHAKQNQAYFYTSDKRKYSTEKSSQIRVTPNGHWKVYENNVPVDDVASEVIRFKTKLLHYDVDGNKTYWKMIEYKPHPSRVPSTSANMKPIRTVR